MVLAERAAGVHTCRGCESELKIVKAVLKVNAG